MTQTSAPLGATHYITLACYGKTLNAVEPREVSAQAIALACEYVNSPAREWARRFNALFAEMERIGCLDVTHDNVRFFAERAAQWMREQVGDTIGE